MTDWYFEQHDAHVWEFYVFEAECQVLRDAITAVFAHGEPVPNAFAEVACGLAEFPHIP